MLPRCYGPRIKILSHSQHLGKFNTSQCCLGRVEGFDLHHRAGQPFHKPVILFDDIVQIFALVNRDFWGFILAFGIKRHECTRRAGLQISDGII